MEIQNVVLEEKEKMILDGSSVIEKNKETNKLTKMYLNLK